MSILGKSTYSRAATRIAPTETDIGSIGQMSTEPSNKHQIQDVDIAITVDVSEVFGLGVGFAFKVGGLVGFCFNQMSTEL